MMKLILIDGHSILNRAFYGVPDLTNSEGLHTNAVYGFLNIMFKFLEEENPTNIAIAFDRKEPTFRHKMFKEYKGTRKKMPDELTMQVPVIKELLQKMGIQTVELPGYEADDILGTLAKKAENEGYEVRIITGDRDFFHSRLHQMQIGSQKLPVKSVFIGLCERFFCFFRCLLDRSSSLFPYEAVFMRQMSA